MNSNNNNKPFSSLKKDKSPIDMIKQQSSSIRDEPTTEKKTAKKDMIMVTSNTKKYQKPGYSS